MKLVKNKQEAKDGLEVIKRLLDTDKRIEIKEMMKIINLTDACLKRLDLKFIRLNLEEHEFIFVEDEIVNEESRLKELCQYYDERSDENYKMFADTFIPIKTKLKTFKEYYPIAIYIKDKLIEWLAEEWKLYLQNKSSNWIQHAKDNIKFMFPRYVLNLGFTIEEKNVINNIKNLTGKHYSSVFSFKFEDDALFDEFLKQLSSGEANELIEELESLGIKNIEEQTFYEVIEQLYKVMGGLIEEDIEILGKYFYIE